MNRILRICAVALTTISASTAFAMREGDPDPAFNGGVNAQHSFPAALSGSQPPRAIGFSHSAINHTYLLAAAYQDSTGPNFSTDLYRILPNGQFDLSFNSTGKKPVLHAPTYVMRSMAVDASNDDIVIVGGNQYFSSSEVDVCRYSASGAIDNNLIGHNGVGCIVIPLATIGGATAVVVDVDTVAVQSWDHRIVIAGEIFQNNGSSSVRSIFVMRLLSTGALDTGFAGTSGVKLYNFGLNGGTDNAPYALAFDSIHRIVVAGSTQNGSGSNSDFAALRLTATGALDSTCGSGTSPCARTFDFHLAGNFADSSAAVLIDSPLPVIYLAGTAEALVSPSNQHQYSTAVIRLNSNFSVDMSYGNSGKFDDFMETNDTGSETDQPPGMAIEGTGKLMLVAGNNSHLAAWRLLPTGVSDSSYDNGSMTQAGRVSATQPFVGQATGERALGQPRILFDGDKPVIGAVTGVYGNAGAIQISVARLLGYDTIFLDDFEQ